MNIYESISVNIKKKRHFAQILKRLFLTDYELVKLNYLDKLDQIKPIIIIIISKIGLNELGFYWAH